MLFSREVGCRLDDSNVPLLFLFFSLLALHVHFFCGRVPITAVLGNLHQTVLLGQQASFLG